MASQSQPSAGHEALKPSEVLERAAALIEPEGAWTQGVAARVRQNRPAHSKDPEATCWCAMGAMLRVAPPEDESDLAFRAGRFVRSTIGRESIGEWNDVPSRQQPEVVAALRKAAELARSEGQ